MELKINCPVREFVKQYLRGDILEIGSSFQPLPINDKTKILYADKYTKAQIIAGLEGQTDPGIDRSKIIEPFIIRDASDLRPFPDNHFDAVINSHILEHICNPVLAIKEWLRVTKPQGFIYMIVPEKTLIFDKDRETTKLEHFISDYENNVARIEQDHYVEYCTKVKHITTYETLNGRLLLAKKMYEDQSDGHFHTFTMESIKSLLEYLKTILNFEVCDIKLESINIAILLKKGK